MTYPKFPPIPRLDKPVIISEKIDGTNGQIVIGTLAPLRDDTTMPVATVKIDGIEHHVYAGSRNRWLTTDKDNFGFAQWVKDNAEVLIPTLGEGQHYGEWWGPGIQRGYGLAERKFSLFNTSRWSAENDFDNDIIEGIGLSVVPELGITQGSGLNQAIEDLMQSLSEAGSVASPGFMNPEGVVAYHTAANQLFKVTFDTPQGKWSA